MVITRIQRTRTINKKAVWWIEDDRNQFAVIDTPIDYTMHQLVVAIEESGIDDIHYLPEYFREKDLGAQNAERK